MGGPPIFITVSLVSLRARAQAFDGVFQRQFLVDHGAHDLHERYRTRALPDVAAHDDARRARAHSLYRFQHPSEGAAR